VATMDDQDTLPPDLAWQRDGHVTDIVLASVSDGEAGIVPIDALSHLDTCEHCSTRLGAEALLSAHAGELLAGLAAPSPSPVKVAVKAAVKTPAKAPALAALPGGAVRGAVVLAAIGAAPSLLDSVARLPALLRAAGRAFMLLMHGAELVVRSDVGTTLAWAASMVLLISGLVVSRMSRVRPSNGLAQEGGV
jgi:hypothetical protein